jgi:ribosome-associated translation inhibitor RaiA
MELRLTANGIEITRELRRFIERRAHFGMGRLAARVRSLAVRLKDVNGPRGGVDQSCDVQVDLGMDQPVIVSERRDNVFSAIALAMDRARRATRRRLANARDARPRIAAPRRMPDQREKLAAAVAAAFARQ